MQNIKDRAKAITASMTLREKVSQMVHGARGCGLTGDNRKGFAEAERIAKDADAVILCLGLSPEIEGEEGYAFNSVAAGDKHGLKLPGVQDELFERLAETGTPLIVVLLSGSPLDLRTADTRARR